MPFPSVFLKVVEEQPAHDDLIREFDKAKGLPDGWCMFAQVYQCKDLEKGGLMADEYAITGILVPHEKAVRIKAILGEI